MIRINLFTGEYNIPGKTWAQDIIEGGDTDE